MRAHLQQLWIKLRASYWFYPSVMAIGAIVLSAVTTDIDGRIEADWPEKYTFIYSNQPDGARALLSTVAGSMITVTGITFSLTLLAVSHATSQFGPRLLTNFMRDRGNQITLGTFIATFLYCLMVLRTVRSPEEVFGASSAANSVTGAFVPHVSIFAALLLTIASVGVLIYFIHHIPESIRLSNVVADVGRELTRSIPELFPEMLADAQPDSQEVDPRLQLPDHFEELSQHITSNTDGYVQTVDDEGLLGFAVENDSVIKMVVVPGDFVSQGESLLLVSSKQPLADETVKRLRFMFAFGAHRTSTQNALFLVDQLVEVASRALSPGVNDPMTAITCIDWLQSALRQLAQRSEPDSYRFDSDGNLRLIAAAARFRDFCSRTFDQLRPYVARDRNVAIHMMQMIARVTDASRTSSQCQLLQHHAELLFEAAEGAGLAASDLAILDELRVGDER